MRAIFTKYHGPGNIRGSRISATDGMGHRVSIGIEPEWSNEHAHDMAVRLLCSKLHWKGVLVRGEDGHRGAGNVYVWLAPDEILVVP